MAKRSGSKTTTRRAAAGRGVKRASGKSRVKKTAARSKTTSRRAKKSSSVNAQAAARPAAKKGGHTTSKAKRAKSAAGTPGSPKSTTGRAKSVTGQARSSVKSVATHRASSSAVKPRATSGKKAKKTVGKKAIIKKTSSGRATRTKVTRRVATSTPPVTSLDTIQFPDKRTPLRKTHLSAKELREFRELLLKKRAELVGDVERLTDEALKRGSGGTSDHSSMPIHMADLGSDNWEREFTLGLIANERDRVAKIDEALERIRNKTYGICLATHRPISLGRLRAKPWAKYGIEYARLRDERQGR